jgi:hypothetical protein
MTSNKEAGFASAGPTALHVVSAQTKAPGDLWVRVGLGIAALSAAFSSFDGLKSLAEAAHWSPYMAPLFALCIDAYALTAIRVWLTRSSSPRAARFARKNAAGAVLLSLLGNAAWHLIDAGLLGVTWLVVLGVGSVPPVILGLVTHLAILRKQGGDLIPRDHEVVPEDDAPVLKDHPEQPAVPEPRPRTVSEDELLAAARLANEEFQQRYGQHITRDLLRTTLGIGGQQATVLLRRLRAADPPAVPKPKAVTANHENL